MATIKGYVEPKQDAENFTCPTCNVRAYQRWSNLHLQVSGLNGGQPFWPRSYRAGRCDSCEALTIWKNQKLVYPQVNLIVEPNPDMPQTVTLDFMEAIRIFN